MKMHKWTYKWLHMLCSYLYRTVIVNHKLFTLSEKFELTPGFLLGLCSSEEKNRWILQLQFLFIQMFVLFH